MAKGRKRKQRQREKTGRPMRRSHGPDRGTPEQQHMRQAITRDQRLSPDYPLSVLLGHGLITEPQHAAGMKFASNYWALFGQPFARSQDLLRGGGGRGMSAGDELSIRAEYEAQVGVLCGLEAVSIVTDLAVFLRFDWLVTAVLEGTDLLHGYQRRHLATICAALDALAGLSVRRPGHEDRAKAEAEAT